MLVRQWCSICDWRHFMITFVLVVTASSYSPPRGLSLLNTRPRKARSLSTYILVHSQTAAFFPSPTLLSRMVCLPAHYGLSSWLTMTQCRIPNNKFHSWHNNLIQGNRASRIQKSYTHMVSVLDGNYKIKWINKWLKKLHLKIISKG